MDNSSTQRGSRSEAAVALDPGVNTVVGSMLSSLRPRGVHGRRLHIQRRRRHGTADDDRCVLAVTTAAARRRTAVGVATRRQRGVLRSAPDHGVSSSVTADHSSWRRQWSRPPVVLNDSSTQLTRLTVDVRSHGQLSLTETSVHSDN